MTRFGDVGSKPTTSHFLFVKGDKMIYLITYLGIGLIIMTLACIVEPDCFDDIVEGLCIEHPGLSPNAACASLFVLCAIIWPIFIFILIRELIRDRNR